MEEGQRQAAVRTLALTTVGQVGTAPIVANLLGQRAYSATKRLIVRHQLVHRRK